MCIHIYIYIYIYIYVYHVYTHMYKYREREMYVSGPRDAFEHSLRCAGPLIDVHFR